MPTSSPRLNQARPNSSSSSRTLSLRRGEEALIFIEPAGDAARQIALWPECKDRLIYVDLSLDLAKAPTINPFQIYGIKAEDTSPPPST